MDAIRSWMPQLAGQNIAYTKYFLGVVTSLITLLSVPIIRIVLRSNGTGSTIADIFYWFMVSVFGFAIIVYPWWLVTAKSPMYSDRLQYYVKIIATISLIFVILRHAFSPQTPFKREVPSVTSPTFKAISTVWWICCLIGFFIVLPILIRREKLFASRSMALFTFAWPYVLLIFTGLVLQEYTGFRYITAYSPLLLLFQVVIVDFIEAQQKKKYNIKSIFDEAYIIVAGFVPFWLATTLGVSLLELVGQAGPMGTVVIFAAWKVLILAFEAISTMIGKKASRTSDGSVYSFCAIYTGIVAKTS